eukprot:403344290
MESQQKTCAKFLLSGEKSAKNSIIYEVQIDKVIYYQIDQNIHIFDGFLLDNLLSPTFEDDVWFDFRDLYSSHFGYKEDAKLLLTFIEYYDEMDIQAQVHAFTCVSDYHRLKEMITIKKLERQFELDLLRLAAFKKFPILVFSDIGGSILYRCNERLNTSRKVDCVIKNRYHYFRPYFDDFLVAIIQHPRVQYGIYSSTMRRNIMPLLNKIFDRPKLRNHKTKIFKIFVQEYNVPDLGYDKKKWATKKRLEKVFKNDKVQKYNFGFSNTLMIDSEVDKIIDYPLNSILVQPYFQLKKQF